MKKSLLMLSPAAITSVALFGAAGPATGKEYEFWRGDLISDMLGWGFDAMAQCHAMSAGTVMIASAIIFSLKPPTAPLARRLPASITGNNKGSAPAGLGTAGVIS